MNIMVIGGGGREHAIIKKLRENPTVETIYALPGNGGISREAQCVPIAATNLDAIVEFAAAHQPDFVVVAPDDPLAMGLVDRLQALGLPCFGPNAAAARIEGSKSFAKDMMKAHHIPTADYAVFEDLAAAKEYVMAHPGPLVVKADGLALGKGVLICQDQQQSLAALEQIMGQKAFGASGDRVVIEEFLTGPEVSVLSFTDGHTIVPMISSMDHKRALDGDQGLNTGGMGVIAPNPFYTPEIAAECMEKIFLPTIRAMAEMGCPFRGCLYFGLMLTPDGPKVIEYNCRFGDPEAQAVLSLLETDLLSIMQAVAQERLEQLEVRFRDGASCCLIMASEGYPLAYQKGLPITDESAGLEQLVVYHSGTKLSPEGELLTNGGRVLGVTGLGDDLAAAVQRAYAGAQHIHFANAYYRQDIGKKALDVLAGK